MRRLLLLLTCVLVVSACEGGTGSVLSTAPASTSTAAPSTTSATSSSAASSPTTGPTAPGPAAGVALDAFFGAAVDLDTRIRDAADMFNSQWDPATATVGPETVAAIAALDAATLRPLIPAGLSPELERMVLAVYADLDSRIAALDGGARYPGDGEFALACLANGGESLDRFADDLGAAASAAELEPAPSVAPDSPQAGVLAVRLEAIRSMNWGCDSCGGVEYSEHFPVDWDGRTVLGVGFDATFDGTAWQILIYAC